MNIKKKMILVSAAVLALSLTACGKKEVEYDAPEDVATGSDARIEHDDSSEKKDETVFEDKLEVGGNTIYINAPLDKPAVNSYNVYNASERKYTRADYEMMIDKCFGGKIYSADYPKAAWERHREVLECKAAEGNETAKQEYEGFMDYYNSLPDDWKQIDSLDEVSPNEVVVAFGDYMYDMEFHESKLRLQAIDLLEPGYANGLFEANKSYSYGDSQIFELADGNEEELNESIDAAMDIIDSLGIGDFSVEYYSRFVVSDSNNQKAKSVTYGYTFICYRNLDGVPCDGSRYEAPVLSDSQFEGYDYSTYKEFEMLEISVDIYGNLMILDYTGPLNIDEKKTSNVNIIDYEKAKSLMLDELCKNTSKYNKTTYYFNYMCLEYMRIRNDDGSFVILPVWCLKENAYHRTVYPAGVVINALDGSVIDAGNEIFGFEIQ